MKQFFALIFFFISLGLFAQKEIQLSGIITDETDNTPIDLAAVILKSSDSVYIADVFTNSAGKFLFAKTPAGKFYIEISYIGFDKYYSNLMEIKTNTEIPAIKLKKNTTLKEVNITKVKNALEFKAGKTVYTVGRDQTNTGLNGLEVLRKIPGVFIDNNDKITVRGKSGIRVYVDDRPSSLSAESPAEAIKFFPAGSIESIEVITNPGAKYDAEGSGAIINIRLKKEKKMGFNGNASIGAGSKYEFSGVNKYNGTFNANIRRNKTNVFVNAGGRQDERRSYNESNRMEASGAKLSSISDGSFRGANIFAKAGLDYFINDRNTFGVSYMINSSKNQNAALGKSTNNYNNPLFLGTNSSTSTYASYLSHTVNFNYILKTKRAGEEFSLDITQSMLDRNSTDSISTGFENFPNLKLNQFSNTGGGVVNNSSQLDYSRALKGDGKFEAGFKNSYISNQSTFNFFNLKSQNWSMDSARSNRFDYYENVAAAYSTYSNKYKKWDYELGLRGEYTIVKSNLTDVNQNYLNLFPDLQVSKKFEESRELSFAYSRRINRVPFMMLSNAVSYSDRYAGQRGNPNLKPEISNSVSIDFQKQFDSDKEFKVGALGASIYGAQAKNSVGYVVQIDTNKVSYITYANIKSTYAYGAEMYIQASYARWYNATVSVSSNYNYLNETSKGFVTGIYTQHSFKFLKHHSMNLNGYYNSKFYTPQGYLKGNYMVNFGYRYTFWKEKGILSLNVSDLFKTGKYLYVVQAQGYNLSGVFQTETRFAYVTFQYKFSKGWQGDGKKRTKKNNKDTRLDFNNNGGGLK